MRKFRERHPERWAEIQRNSQDKNRERIRARARARWHEKPEIRERAAQRRASERERAIARTVLWRAIRDGFIQRGACEVGADCLGQIEGHHEDYAQPLAVRWLCKRHHMQLHSQARNIGHRLRYAKENT